MVAGVLQLHAGASAEWYSERRAHPEEKFQSALVSQLLGSLGTSVPLLFARLTLRGVPVAFACKREATPIKRNLLTPRVAHMVTA